MDCGECGLEGGAGGPVAVDAGDFAAGEDLADDERPAFGLGYQEPARVRIQHLGAWRREAAALGFEEVADVARGAAVEADLGEGGLMPDHFGLRKRGETGWGVEPDGFFWVAVVVADAAVAIGPAVGDETGAGERGAVDAAGGLRGVSARAIAGDGLRRGGDRDREEAGQQERRRREQRYVFWAVSSSVMRVKN